MNTLHNLFFTKIHQTLPYPVYINTMNINMDTIIIDHVSLLGHLTF